MPPRNPVVSREAFTNALLEFVQKELARPTAPTIGPETLLFEGGFVNSLGILRLMGFLEAATGRSIPHALVVMKNFRTVEMIVDRFYETPGEETP